MTNEVTKTETPITLGSLAPAGVDGRVWVRVLKEQLMSSKTSEPTNEELLYFAQVAQSTGLDPVKREIYAIFRNTKQRDGSYKPRMSIQTGIDGLRVAAERSGKYAGSREPQFVYDKDVKITVNYGGKPKTVPNIAKVTVVKVIDGNAFETTRTANWADYYPGEKEGMMWAKFPEVMLAKCAEAQALRAAFPNLGQLYLDEEMEVQDAGVETGVNMKAVAESIKNATTTDEMFEIIKELTIEQQKEVAELATQRAKELADESSKK